MSNDWFWEGNVVESLEKHFRDQGWSFVSKADTASRQAGVDLHMSKGDVELLIEAKGYPSTGYQRGPNQGKPKRTTPLDTSSTLVLGSPYVLDATPT